MSEGYSFCEKFRRRLDFCRRDFALPVVPPLPLHAPGGVRPALAFAVCGFGFGFGFGFGWAESSRPGTENPPEREREGGRGKKSVAEGGPRWEVGEGDNEEPTGGMCKRCRKAELDKCLPLPGVPPPPSHACVPPHRARERERGGRGKNPKINVSPPPFHAARASGAGRACE